MATTLPLPSPHDLTLPNDDGASTARQLLSTYLKLQYRALMKLPYAALLGDEQVGGEFADMIGTVAKTDAGFLFNVLRKPTVGGLIRLIVRQSGSRQELSDWTLQLLAQVNTELVAIGRARGTIAPAGRFERLASLHAGFTIDLEGVDEVAFEGDRIRVRRGGTNQAYEPAEPEGPGVDRPYHSIRGPIVLSTWDNNPRAGEEAHPEKEGNHVDLGGRPVEEWVTSIRDALGIIEEYVPELIPEMDVLLHQIFPVGYEPEKHLSASMMDVVGNIYMTLHPDPMILAEAIIHEFSHNKINALWTLAPLLENAFHPLYTSPVRPDPRPLFGVLLAVHAFLPVEEMYLRMSDRGHPMRDHPRFKQRREQIRSSNAAAASTVLDNAVATEMGENVLAEIRRLDDRFEAAGAVTQIVDSPGAA